VRSYETDPQGRLEVPILCKLMQETAVAHAAILGVSVETLMDNRVAWVLSHLDLKVERWPGPDAEITIKTWPEAASRLIIERRFEVLDSAGELSASASTYWLVLDLKRRRPVRLPAVVLEAMTKHEIGSATVKPDRLEQPDLVDLERVFTVRRSDLDLADHVNNTSYIEWAMEAVPDEVWTRQELAELQISFLSECHQGQTIVSVSQTTGDARGSEVRHQLVRREDGELAALARTVWRSTG
jgi:medium-chain acyl-[acyl-carrier-protein] hydrolase